MGNFARLLDVMKLILALLPMILEAIKAIEAAMPQSGKGAEKLAALRMVIENAYNAGGATLGAFTSIWPAIESTVAGFVTLFNSAGVFKKSDSSGAK